MTTVLHRFDMTDVERGLAAMVQAGKSPRQAFKLLRLPSKADQIEHGKKMEGPSGAKWQPRAASTVRRAKNAKSRKRAKTATRRILNSLPRRALSAVATGSALVVASKVPWAGIHQHGGTAGRGAKIPARPFIYFSDEFIEKALVVLRAHIILSWRRG